VQLLLSGVGRARARLAEGGGGWSGVLSGLGPGIHTGHWFGCGGVDVVGCVVSCGFVLPAHRVGGVWWVLVGFERLVVS